MSGPELYYTPPTEKQFLEVKVKAREVWFSISDDQRYLDEKLQLIDSLENVGDNFMTMVAMFDPGNQRKLAESLSEETRKAIRDRLIDGGADTMNIIF